MATTSPILDCLLVEGVPILTWIRNQIDAIEADILLIEADLVAIKNRLTAIEALLAALQACCDSIQAYIANAHVRATLTHNQDVANRTTLNVATQVLNIPPPIAARRIGTGLNVPVPTNTWVTITGLTTIDLDTTAVAGSPMVPVTPDGEIVIVKTGRYNLTIVAGTSTLNPGHAITVRGLINGVLAGAASAPYAGAGLNVQAIQWIPLHEMTAGDTLGVAVRTDDPAGIVVAGAYIAVEYVEGT